MYEDFEDYTEQEEELDQEFIDKLSDPSQITDEERQQNIKRDWITAILETAPENVELIKKFVDASIVSAFDFCVLFNKAIETQDDLLIHLVYSAASHFEDDNFEPVLTCFEHDVAEDNSLSSFQIAVLMIFSTNPNTQQYIDRIFLRALQTNPFIADFIGEYFKINKDATNKNGQNALQISADYGQIEMFKFLIERPELEAPIGKFLDDDKYEKYYNYLNHRDATKSKRPLLFSIAQSPAYKELLPIFIQKAKELAIPTPYSKHDRLNEFFDIFKAQDEKGNTWMTYLINRNVQDVLDRLKFFESCGVNLGVRDQSGKNLLDYICLYFSDMPYSKPLAEFLINTCKMKSQEAQYRFPDIVAQAKKNERASRF